MLTVGEFVGGLNYDFGQIGLEGDETLHVSTCACVVMTTKTRAREHPCCCRMSRVIALCNNG